MGVESKSPGEQSLHLLEPSAERKEGDSRNHPLSDVPSVWAVLIYFVGSVELVNRTKSIQGFHSAIFIIIIIYLFIYF